MNQSQIKRVVVIGGGAAGLSAAVACAWKARLTGAPVEVCVFESDDRVGRSILATGNGRCNFSNSGLASCDYWGASAVDQVFSALEHAAFWPRTTGRNAVLDFFAALGLSWREEAEGRLFPATGKASTVLDVLRHAAAKLGVRECCDMRVARVELPREEGKPFTLRMADGTFERAEALICACGGAVARELLPGAFSFEPLRPMLGPLKTDVSAVRVLDNIRIRCLAKLLRDGVLVAEEQGEVLFRKYGLSGIAIFNLSRFAQQGDVISLDVIPWVDDSQAAAWLRERAAAYEALTAQPATCEDVLRGVLLPLVCESVCRKAGVQPNDVCDAVCSTRLAAVCKSFEVVVHETGDAKQCQVHRGGFATDQFDCCTMESRVAPGLYAAGEMLDVDGPCGGYNLHFAWASGALAGISAAG